MVHGVAPIVASIGAAVGSGTLAVLAEVGAADPSVVTYAQLGTTGAVTAALAYFLRKVASGQMVFRDTAEQQAAAALLAERLTRLVEEHQELARSAQKREDRLWSWVERSPHTRGGPRQEDER
jgi:hypothetical protein